MIVLIMHKDWLENTTLISRDEDGFNFIWKKYLVLFKYFRNWLLNTGDKQYKQADGDRLIEVKITVI